LSLPTGPNFGPVIFRAGWKSHDARAAGAMFLRPEGRVLGVLVLRRRIDHCFVPTHSADGFASEEDALKDLTLALKPGEPPEPIPPGVKRRRPLLKALGPKPGKHFKLLTSTIAHVPALLAIGEVYLAMPRPDDNFVPGFQTANFDSRLLSYIF
jgi:hypothetical protein